MEPSPAFLAVRDALLRSDEADRRRLVGLYGSMTDPLPDPSKPLRELLVAIAALDDAEQIRVARWVRRYVTKWGQIPAAAGRQIMHPDRKGESGS